MRRILTGGIKAVLAIAALSTAAHWAMRMRRAPEPTAAVAVAPVPVPDPVTTGSIQPRKVERAVPPVAEAPTQGLDQQHLMKLISGAAVEKPRAQKAVAKR